MATYATYRHIELDNVGYSKKRVQNQSSEIYSVLSATPSPNGSSKRSNGYHSTPNRSDSFNRLFGTPENGTPRRTPIKKYEKSPRNPVTGDGVISWDHRPGSRNTPRTPKTSVERNPVTGETYIISPVSTPTKTFLNGHGHGHEMKNGYEKQNGMTNGHDKQNGHQNGH